MLLVGVGVGAGVGFTAETQGRRASPTSVGLNFEETKQTSSLYPQHLPATNIREYYCWQIITLIL